MDLSIHTVHANVAVMLSNGLDDFRVVVNAASLFV